MPRAKKKSGLTQTDTKGQNSCPHCGKTFAALSGLSSHMHYLHPDKPGLVAKSAVAARPATSPKTAARAGKAKALKCEHCGKSFERPSSLATHIRYLHAAGSSKTTAAAPAKAAPPAPAKISAPAPAPAPVPAAGPNATVEEHLKTALQELIQRQNEVDAQLARMETLRSEQGAIARQIDALNSALQAFAG
jgi:hypothetical protein